MAEESNKNMEKYKSYKFAFFRIDQAIDKAFPVEAIAFEESIISDRLRAYCEANGKPIKGFSFNNLITASQAISKDNCPELHQVLASVHSWKNDRNKMIHSVVKTEKSGEAPEISYKDFIPQAMEIAKTGKALARTICNISTKLKHEAEKQVKESGQAQESS